MQYSAKLLFQFRVARKGVSLRRRLCEERIVSFRAASPQGALAKAKKLGQGAEHDYESAAGGRVFFEFLGVMELIDVSAYSDDGEVWYELLERVDPDRRLKTLLVPETQLHALRNDIPRRKRTPRL